MFPDMREAREARMTLHGVESVVLEALLRFCYSCSCSIATGGRRVRATARQRAVACLDRLRMQRMRSPIKSCTGASLRVQQKSWWR